MLTILTAAARAENSPGSLAEVIVGLGNPAASMDVNGDGALDSGDVVKLALMLTPTPTPIPAARVVAEVASGDPCGPVGSTFTLRIHVAENGSGRVPAAATYRLHYSPERFEFRGLAEGQLGVAEYGPETATDGSGLPSHFRGLATFSNLTNTDATPTIFEASFRVVSVGGDWRLALTPDPNAIASLIDRRLQRISDSIDDSAAEGLCVLATPTATGTVTPTPLPSTTPTTGTLTPTPWQTPLVSLTPLPTFWGTPSVTPTPIIAATLFTSVTAGDPCGPVGSRFTISVGTNSNTTGRIPMAASMRIYYPADRVTFVGATQRDLGSAFFGPEEVSGSWRGSHYRTIATTGNFANQSLKPTLFDAEFEVKAPGSTFSIGMGDEFTEQCSLLDRQTQPLPFMTSTWQTDGLCRPTPTPSPTRTPSPTPTATPSPTVPPVAVVSAWLAEGNACAPNSDFVVRVGVRQNPTNVYPAAASLRVYYPADSVEFMSAGRAQFGTVTASAETTATLGGLPVYFRDISAAALPAGTSSFNPDLTPVAFEMLFRTRSGALPPGSIVIDDTPGLNGLADRTSLPIAHVFDNSPMDSPCDAATATPTPTATPAGSAVVLAQISQGSACRADSNFTVRLNMPTNTTGLKPATAYFRLYYPADQVDFVATWSGFSHAYGPPIAEIRPGYPSHYRNIYVSLGSTNSSTTPIFVNAAFRTRSDYQYVPFSILVTDDPYVDVSLRSTTNVAIPHLIDDSALEMLCRNVSSPTPQPTPSPETSYTATPSLTPWVTASPSPETPYTATPSLTPWVTASPTPETHYPATPSLTPWITASPSPETKYSPTPWVTASPSPEETDAPTPEVTLTPWITATVSPTEATTPSMTLTPEATHPPTPSPLPPPEPVVLQSRVISGDPCVPNSTFVVRLQAMNAESGFRSLNGELYHLHYPGAAVSLVSMGGNLTGVIFPGNPQASTIPGLPDTFREIFVNNLGPSSTADPVIFDATFRTASTLPPQPWSIVVQDQLGRANSYYDIRFGTIPYSYDTSGTTALCGVPPGS